MKIVSILNHKGGVGKTTFTGCSAQALALFGYRTLVIDNDSQHNLSSMLGAGSCTPSVRDIYRASADALAPTILKSIRKTVLEGLHIITSESQLCDGDITDVNRLRDGIEEAQLEKYYDFILIDNAPGMATLQAASVACSHEIFVPTELRQFAIDGIVEMEQTIAERFHAKARISKIIPNFYRPVKRQNTFIAALNHLFAGRVTRYAIPFDNVFDELITENKVLFLHRFSSKGAASYLSLIGELFGISEEQLWNKVRTKRDTRLRDEARQRYYTQLSLREKEQ